MKIELHATDETLAFRDLKGGDVFSVPKKDFAVYMKLDAETYGFFGEHFNCVLVDSGDLDTLDGEDRVILFPNAKLVL